MSNAEHQQQVQEGERFEFGKNWQSFLSVVNEDRIAEAVKSLKAFLGVESLAGKSFLDIGSGSGLFSLAARRLGARVRSFDFDPASVASTREMKRRYFPDDSDWEIGEGSVLDRAFIEGLGKFDVVYSWGVLHHTGHLNTAVFNAHLPVAGGGLFYIAIYNDQLLVSSLWTIVKRAYCSGSAGRVVMKALFYPAFFTAGLLIDLAHFRDPRARYAEHIKHRGMSLVHDWKDWLGGLPYEVATAERMKTFVENLGFELVNFKEPPIGFGNNQFVFRRKTGGAAG